MSSLSTEDLTKLVHKVAQEAQEKQERDNATWMELMKQLHEKNEILWEIQGLLQHTNHARPLVEQLEEEIRIIKGLQRITVEKRMLERHEEILREERKNAREHVRRLKWRAMPLVGILSATVGAFVTTLFV